ncbi:MAG TPA: LPXTG cell wall anchor domain-containing protein, partial [Candidatus Polarisedimenticolaceae bacterium]|nr:LPXTG cell wall anchor domain-containing protein [Candidatus Polarisedimenticolaceae bacterium]
YNISYVKRYGYHLSPHTPHPLGANFTVQAGQTTVVSIILDRDAAAPAPVTSTKPGVVTNVMQVQSPTPMPTPAPAPVVAPIPVAAVVPTAASTPAPQPVALPQTGPTLAGLMGLSGILLTAWYYLRSRQSLRYRQREL